MSCYLDTSLLVPLLIREPGTPRVQALFDKFRSLRLELVPLEAADFEAAAQALRCQRCAIAGR
ncbi:hypothetical protein LBMAG40_12820 [Cyanobium sp.]|nr:hypothetical protein LBMAG40_12820 [Cyanobium sp.]